MLTSPAGLFLWWTMRGPASGTYESPGKQAFRDLLFSLAKATECQSYGTFWGTGIDSRMFASEFDVIACEIVQAKHEAMAADAANGGYSSHFGRAGRLTRHVDMFHADFDGGPSPSNFREVRRIAVITDLWLAVTLSMDHLHDESMMGEAAFYTLPAWLTGASGFTLEYLSRYRRNRFGQTMWTAILQRREGKGNWHPVQPLQVAYSVRERRYWASRQFYSMNLLQHRFAPRNQREKASDHARYIAKRSPLADRECRSCGTTFSPSHGRQVHCTMTCRTTTYRKAWYSEHRDEQIAVVRAWRTRRKAAVSGTAAKPSILEEAA